MKNKCIIEGLTKTSIEHRECKICTVIVLSRARSSPFQMRCSSPERESLGNMR